MKTASSEKYLGDIINNSGKIDESIQSRKNKGIGTVNSIISMIEEISFGEHTFQIGLLFRNSMLINSMLCSSEVLYGITNAHIQTFEECDKSLFTQLFGVPISCSYEAFFYETGALPVRHILIGRRLIYYWTLLNKSDDELVKKVFNIQKKFPVRGDWIKQIESDLLQLKIEQSESEIKCMKKEEFKKLVKEKLETMASNFLEDLKENHSKTEKLFEYKLQNYLTSQNLSTEQKKLLFSLRTRSIHVKTNYRNKYKFNMFCSLCDDKTEEESELHLLRCLSTVAEVGQIGDSKYEDIFSPDGTRQDKITEIFRKIFRIRKTLVNKLN